MYNVSCQNEISEEIRYKAGIQPYDRGRMENSSPIRKGI